MHLLKINFILQLPEKPQQNSENEILMSMQDWVEQTNQFLKNNRRDVLDGKGKIFHDMAMKKAEKEYEVFLVS